MSEFFRRKEVVGLKPHKCEQCGRYIEKGEKHLYSVMKFDGDFSAYREHVDCHGVWLELRKLGELAWDEPSDFLKEADLSEDREWITKDHPTIASRLFGPQPQEHRKANDA